MLRPRPFQRSIAGALTVVVLAGCAGTVTPSASPTAPAEGQWVPETPWEQALEAIGEDGQFSLDAALTLFATAFGPLPGVQAEHDLTGVASRTLAVDAIEAHRDALTDEQRAAVDGYLATPADAVTVEIPPAAAAAGGIVLAAAVPETTRLQVEQFARQARSNIASNLGRDMNGFVKVVIAPRPGDVQPVEGLYPLAQATPSYDGGVFAGCTITVFTQATAEGQTVLNSLLVHEVFHCFQRDGYRTQEARDGVPAWVIEGQAAWVGQSLGGASGKYARFWKRYLTAPRISLTQRHYDAIGFYSHLAETGTNPWSVFPAMWAAGKSSVNIYRAVKADSDAFIHSWASGVIRQPARGPAWDTTGPGITSDAFQPVTIGIGPGIQVDAAAAFFTNHVDMLAVSSEFLYVEVDGHIRLSDGTADITAPPSAWYCIRGKECVCPDGQRPPFQVAATLEPQIALAVSGGVEGTVGLARGASLDEFCRQTPRPDEADGCDDCAMSNGDPHLVTVDGSEYDFQAAGEFVALRAADDSFELQVRQKPLAEHSEVTINTAIALRLGGTRLQVTLDQDSNELHVQRDGQPLEVSQAVDLGGGASIAPTDSANIVINAADGTTVDVIGLFGYGMNLVIDPSDSLRQTGVGLLGPAKGPSRLPALPDGSELPEPFTREDYYTSLYITLADAWRVTAATSLFVYAPGTSTDSYTIRDHPGFDDMILITDLTPEQRAAGERACAFLPAGPLKEQCIFDVGLTSDLGFADIYDLTADVVTAKGGTGGSGELMRVVNLYADDKGPVDVDVYSWTDEGGAFVATVPYGEVSDWFEPALFVQFERQQLQLSFTRHGEALLDWAFNLADMAAREPEKGSERTITLTTGDPDRFGPDGVPEAIAIELFEEIPDSILVPRAPEGLGLLLVNANGLDYTLPDQRFYASIGDGCLTQPGFAGLAEQFGSFSNTQLEVPPGSHQLTLHAANPEDDPFAVRCDSPPLIEPLPLTLAEGERAHLFLYAQLEATEPEALLLPFGR